MEAEVKETLVLGLGNPLMTDDGVGVEAVRVLEERYVVPAGIDIVDGGTMGLYLLDRVAGYRRLLVADSVALDQPPGTLVRLAGDEIDAVFSACLSPHQTGVNDLLAALALLGQRPAEVIVIGMVPASIETGVGLSAAVADRLEGMIENLVGQLGSWGFTLLPRGA